MKKRKYSQFRRNPLVRLIRWIYKFFKSLSKPKKSISRSSHRREFDSDEHRRVEPLKSITKLDTCAKGGLITVGELLEQVNWHFPQEIDRKTIVDLSPISRTHDVSKN